MQDETVAAREDFAAKIEEISSKVVEHIKTIVDGKDHLGTAAMLNLASKVLESHARQNAESRALLAAHLLLQDCTYSFMSWAFQQEKSGGLIVPREPTILGVN